MQLTGGLIGLPVLFSLLNIVEVALTAETTVKYRGTIEDYGFVVGIGIGDEKVFCLGAIASVFSILSMASCFEEYEGPMFEYYDDYEEDEPPRLSRAKRNSIEMRRYLSFRSQNKTKSHNGKRLYTSPTPPPTTTEDSENEEETPESNEYSLFRIDEESHIFVRVGLKAGYLTVHPEFGKINTTVDLWRHDIAMLFIINDTMDLNAQTKMRPIVVFASTYGNYMKAMNEEMMNTEVCQVIGLIEYADGDAYTPRDMDVRLVSHDVMVDYDECNATFCTKIEDCLETGHHIYKETMNPMPYFVRGSPLVCRGELLSLVNIHSHCNDSKSIAAIGTDDTKEIFCLGSVISHTAVLTLASCFDGYDYELDAIVPKDHNNLRARRLRKMRAKRHGKLKANQRSTEAHKVGRNTSVNPAALDGAGHEYDEDKDGVHDQETDIISYWLYRINTGLQTFVRLAVDGKMIATHPDYKAPDNNAVKLWRNDVAFIFTSAPMDFTKVHPIPLATVGFGEYIKSLHEEMVNTMNCQVIGLIEYADNATYTPVDTEVQLVAHDVLVVYDKCDKKFCLEDQELCEDTGHHIHRDPTNPMPYFLGGSPLVCEGKLLSVVNIHSHCDDSKYSAEFAAPEVVRHHLKSFSFLEEEGRRDLWKYTFPKVPYPKWAVRSGGANALISLHVSSSLVLCMIENIVL